MDRYDEGKFRNIMKEIFWKMSETVDMTNLKETKALENESIIAHMDKWRKEHKGYYVSANIFWKEMFKEFRNIL